MTGLNAKVRVQLRRRLAESQGSLQAIHRLMPGSEIEKQCIDEIRDILQRFKQEDRLEAARS